MLNDGRSYRTLHPAIYWVSSTDLAHAILAALCAIIFLTPILLFVFRQPTEVVVPFVLVSATLPFGLIVVQRVVILIARIWKQSYHVWYGWAEAKAELLTGLDLNHSGRVGDNTTRMLYQPAGPVVEVMNERPIIANKAFPEQPRWKRGEGEKQVMFYQSEVKEFVERAKGKGLARKHWTGEKASDGTTQPQYQFSVTGRGCTREVYDLLVDTIIQKVPESIIGRSKGHDGKMVYPEKILEAFGL